MSRYNWASSISRFAFIICFATVILVLPPLIRSISLYFSSASSCSFRFFLITSCSSFAFCLRSSSEYFGFDAFVSVLDLSLLTLQSLIPLRNQGPRYVCQSTPLRSLNLHSESKIETFLTQSWRIPCPSIVGPTQPSHGQLLTHPGLVPEELIQGGSLMLLRQPARLLAFNHFEPGQVVLDLAFYYS